MAGKTARALTPEEQTKVIVVAFADGPLDGAAIASDSDDVGEAEQAVSLYLNASDGGRIGARYRTKSDADIGDTEHIYEVVDRDEGEASIRVRFQYMGTDE